MNNVLIEKLTRQYGSDITSVIIKSYSSIRNTTIRINTIKSNSDEVKEALTKNNISYKDVGWSTFSLILEEKQEEKIKELEIYKEGKIYLQSLSSQLPPLFLNPKSKELILDMTAAPGGKTTEIAALSNNGAMITAIEKNKIRFEKLKYNLEKQGAKKVTILNIDARQLDSYFLFDKILLDAPCSGSGTLVAETISTFDEDLLNRSKKFQHSLLEEAIKHLNKNGELIYSTCSILKEENEDQIKEILAHHKNIKLIPLEEKEFEEIPKLPVDVPGTLCVLPDKNYEGFFVAKLKRVE